ncbi:Retrovirus-related Pol polyprotein from transposon TNT 1-94 [Senna tora]|uniref:Retrovirus-related Pol polyprotein from transposon TNT 1-94 n=1 Tax=Senna tora TaxID=362788 RepID=A0A834SR52_9FABA|nr:Retrovirus-related Pol polyprotein from transposon TNT 1-94 [Senna tora]
MGLLFEKCYDMRVHQGFCTLFDKNGRFVAKDKIKLRSREAEQIKLVPTFFTMK